MNTSISPILKLANRVLFFVFVYLLTACSTPERPFATNLPVNQLGTVVLSVAFPTGREVTIGRLDIRNRQTGQKVDFRHHPSNPFHGKPIDFENDGRKGTVYILDVPPGEYEIYSFSGIMVSGVGSSSWGPKEDISIKFSVRSGETSYLGEYLFEQVQGKNLLGGTVPEFVYLVIADSSNRDLPIAYRRRPDLTTKASLSVAKAADVGHRLVRNTPL